MKFTTKILRACAGVTGSILAISLTACGGGSGSQNAALPQAAALQPAQNDSTIKSIAVSPSGAATIMSNVRAAGAYYSPVAGGHVKPLPAAAPKGVSTQSAAMQLSYYGGPVVGSEQSYDLYVNCQSTCWGNPGTFLGYLATSNMIHILDQYTNSSANNRYTYAGGLGISYNTSYTLQDQDIYNIVYAAAKTYGTGYGKVYHVFLASGVQQCSQAAGGCYAQQYCAYHGSVDFSDIGHTLYSVEPYQGINGCMTQSGKLSDASASTLSHELFETITDPDVSNNNLAWYNYSYGEIGDECRNSMGNVSVSGYTYNIQREYSNRYSACTFSP